MLRTLTTPGLFFCVSLLTSSAFAGAWTQPEGRRQLIQNLVFYSTSEAFNAVGDRVDVPRFSKFEINPYYEVGMSDATTLGISGFVQYLRQNEPREGKADNLGIGETELFVRQRLYAGQGFSFAVQPLLKLPSHYRSDNAPVAGRANWDAELAMLGGYGFSWLGQSHYVDMKAGYRYRSERLEDQWRASAALGLGLASGIRLVPELHWTGRVHSGGAVDSLSGQNDHDLLKAQISVVYSFSEQYGAQVGMFRHVAGEDTGAGGGVLVALWRQW